jgi:hypothetical protein
MKTHLQKGWKGTFSYTHDHAAQLAKKWTKMFRVMYRIEQTDCSGERHNDRTWRLCI